MEASSINDTDSVSGPAGLHRSNAEVQGSAHRYAEALEIAGGEQMGALMRAGKQHAVCAALYHAPAYDLQVPALQVSRLSLNLTPAHVSGFIEGERARSYETGRYSLFMTPAGAAASWQKKTPSRHIAIYYARGALDSEDETASPLAELRPLMNLKVPGLRPWVDQLLDELRHGNRHHTDAADSLARLLLIQVSRHLRRSRQGPRAISPPTVERLRDFVMAHIGERILVADLARQAGMSVDSFALAYKAQTGQSPHQFVLAVRLERAAELLRSSSLELAEVAQACGFSSQQHLTHAMRRHLDTTPARYRHGHSE